MDTTMHYWIEVTADNADEICIEASAIVATTYWGIDTGKLAKLAKAAAGKFDRGYVKRHDDNVWPIPTIRGLYQDRETGTYEGYSTSADGRRNGESWALKAKTLRAALQEMLLSIPEIKVIEDRNRVLRKASTLRSQAAQLEMEYA